MNAQDILQALRNPRIEMDHDQIRTAFSLLRNRSDDAQRKKAMTFAVGDTVQFEARGEMKRGEVKKINSKTVQVRVGTVDWRVAPSLLVAVPQ